MTTLDADHAEADVLAALADRVLAMPAEQRKAYLLRCDGDRLETIERALAMRASIGWRQNPATFANHLTGGVYKLWRYVVLLGDKFRSAADGEHSKQIWMLPSQMGKTTTLTWGIVWLLDRDPTVRIMYVSYDGDRAVEVGGAARDIAEGRHPDVAPEMSALLRFRLRADQRARGRWTTEQGGGLYCVGILGGITGFPQDVVLGDDLIKGWEAAHSPATRNKTWNIYRSQMRMRLQGNDDPVIIVGTRWHEDDIQARLMAAAEQHEAMDQWHVVRLAAIAEEPRPDSSDPLLRSPDPLGRAPGEVIEPLRFPKAEVDARRVVLGTYLWTAMEQGRPAPEEGDIVKRAWFKIGDSLPEKADEWLSSADTKMLDKEGGDFAVVQVWCRTGKDCWLVDQVRGQWDQSMTENAIALMAVRWPQCKRHAIEAKALGPIIKNALSNGRPDYAVSDDVAGELGMTVDERSAVNALRRRGLGGIVMNPVKGDKPARMRAVSPYIEAGDVHLWSGARYLGVYLDEMVAFPNGGFDDQCLPAGTLVLRPDGPVPIESVAIGDVVLGAAGWVEVLRAWCTGVRPVVDDRSVLRGTADHPVFTQRGWTGLGELTDTDTVVVCDALLRAAIEKRRQQACACAATSGHGDSPAAPNRSSGSSNAPSTAARTAARSSAATAGSTTDDGERTAIRPSSLQPSAAPSASRASSSPGSSFAATRIRGWLRTVATSRRAVSGSSAASRLSTAKSGRRTTARSLPAMTSTIGTASMTTRSAISSACRSLSMPPNIRLIVPPPVEARSNSSILIASGLSLQHGIAQKPAANGIDATREHKPSDAAPVFNLTTTDGTYFADGLLVHNCDTTSQALAILHRHALGRRRPLAGELQQSIAAASV